MKRSVFAVLPALLLCFSTSFASMTAPAEASPARADSDIDKHMKVINTSMRKLRAMMKDDSKVEEALTTVLEMQSHALQAKAFEPKRATEIEEAEARATFVLEYRKGMHQFLNGMFSLEVALLERDMDAANEVYKEMQKGKSEAHEKFKAEDDH